MFWLWLTPYDNFELGGTLSYFNLSLTDNLTMTSFLHYSQAFNRRWHRHIFRKYSNNINISEILLLCIAPSWIINEKKYFFFTFQSNQFERPFVNFDIGTSVLELELILQTSLFPVPRGLWNLNLAGWWLRMKGPLP